MAVRVTVECPNCYDPLAVVGLEGQTVECKECRRWYWVTFDVQFADMEPPDWREVEGDLRYHGRN